MSGGRGGFARIPNETLRDDRLSYAARGLLAEALSHGKGWEHASADATRRRAALARPGDAESRRDLSTALQLLERFGYRHRVRRRGPRGRIGSEIRYYDRPVRPCADAPNCASCRPPADQPAVTRCDLGKHPVSAGRTDIPPTEGSVGGNSSRRQTPEDRQKKPPPRIAPPGIAPPGIAAKPAPAPPARPAETRGSEEDRVLGWLTRECGPLGDGEATTALAMVASGAALPVIANKITAERRRPRTDEMFRSGRSVGEIAERLGVSIGAVARDLAAAGWATSSGRPPTDLDPYELAQLRAEGRQP